MASCGFLPSYLINQIYTYIEIRQNKSQVLAPYIWWKTTLQLYFSPLEHLNLLDRNVS